MASKIFINYRRGDSPGTAGRLHDRLAQTFGPDNSFIDVENTKAADDADARRMAEKAEQQRLTALWVEEERKKTAAELESRVKAELIDNERRAALRAEEERRAKAATEAEARRKSDEAERQRIADLRTEGLVTTSRSGAAREDENAPTLLESSFVSTWAIETPLNCNLPSKSYSLKVEDGNIIWRDGTGNIDIETVVLSAETEFRTITLKSVHHNGRGEKSGTTWTYSSLGRDRLSVKPGG